MKGFQRDSHLCNRHIDCMGLCERQIWNYEALNTVPTAFTVYRSGTLTYKSEMHLQTVKVLG